MLQRTQKWALGLNNALLKGFTKTEQKVIQWFLDKTAAFQTSQSGAPLT